MIQNLRLFSSQSTHVFRIDFNWIIAQLRLCNRLQVVTANRKVTVTLYPPDTPTVTFSLHRVTITKQQQHISLSLHTVYLDVREKHTFQKCYDDLMQSMWIEGRDLYSPWESRMKPISRHMSSPWNAARASTNGLRHKHHRQRNQ